MVIYSMGNFISHQHGLERNSGIILRMKFIKDFKHGVTRLVQVGYIPTYSHSYYEEDRIKFRVVTVEKTLEDIKMGRETILSQEDIPVLEQVLESTSSSNTISTIFRFFSISRLALTICPGYQLILTI
jgi:hypothetical protein